MENEVDEIEQSNEGHVIESRTQMKSRLYNAERLAIEELQKEFNCPISLQVLSKDKSYLFDAVIHEGRKLIFIEVKYIINTYLRPGFVEQIRRFAQAVGDYSKIVVIVTPELLDESIKERYRTTIADVDKSIELRFYKL